MSYRLVDYRCRDCRRVEELFVTAPGPDAYICPECGGVSDKLFGAPKLHMPFVTVDRRSSSDRDAPPMALGTDKLADGMSHDEWKKERKDKWARKRWAETDKHFGDPRATIYGGKASSVKSG